MNAGQIVPEHSDALRLAEQRNVTVILRLVLDHRGQLRHGEIVDVEGRAISRFVGWRDLTRNLKAWLATPKQDSALDQQPHPP